MAKVVIAVGGETRRRRSVDARIGVITQLRRMPGETPPEWVRVHQPSGRRPPSSRADGTDAYRVLIEAGGDVLGSIWATRGRAAGQPDAEETRLLAATADQLGQAIAHDRMAAEAHAADVAQRERRAQVGTPAVGLARPAHAAGNHPRRGRHAAA